MLLTLPGPPSIPDIRKGYPLSYFATTEPFATWLRHGVTVWTDVYIERFSSRRMDDSSPWPYNGAYEHILEFTTTRDIAIALPEPKGVIALFGEYDKKKEPDGAPARLRLRFIVEPKYGQLIQLDISGAIRFRLPQSLVRPVIARDDHWDNDPNTTHVVVPLGNSIISLVRGQRPELSSPLVAPDVTVRIGQTGIVARLNVARIDIAGTATEPKLQFSKIQFVYLTH